MKNKKIINDIDEVWELNLEDYAITKELWEYGKIVIYNMYKYPDLYEEAYGPFSIEETLKKWQDTYIWGEIKEYGNIYWVENVLDSLYYETTHYPKSAILKRIRKDKAKFPILERRDQLT